MKKLLLLISFSILSLYSFTQIDVQRDSRVNPILKRAVTPNSGYITFGRTDPSRLINIAVLNQSSHVISWFTCHGRLFDSTKLTNSEFEQVTQKQLDPFGLYQNITDKYLTVITAVKDIYRVNGDIPIGDSLNAGYYALSSLESIRKAKTPLQKLIAVENIRKNILTQRAYLNCTNPFRLKNDLLFTADKELAGVMIKTEDSTIYYNIDPTSAINKIGLYKKSPEILYIYNRLSELIDSMPVLPGKYDLLLKEKTDVFLLYRGWLELQWQSTISAIKRQTSSFNTNEAQGYSQVNLREERAIKKELYSQLHAIETKINLLISPDEKSIEQAVYETYKSETSEINYIPLLGIGYNLTQTRGLKEYELANHLGNVLATISDRKIGVSSPADSSLIDHYEPDIVSAQDYYPFGMLQPGRSYLSPTGNKYRYGFNGKENDNEVKGEGNQQDYGMRVYDPRIGKFLSVDPLTKSFPQLSPYQFAENEPVAAIDLDGLEKFVVTNWYNTKNELVKIVIKTIRSQQKKQEVDLNFKRANGGDLTSKNVYVRNLYMDGSQKAMPGEKDNLSEDEKKIYASAKSIKPNWKEGMFYDFSDQKNGKNAVSALFNSTKFEYAEAEALFGQSPNPQDKLPNPPVTKAFSISSDEEVFAQGSIFYENTKNVYQWLIDNPDYNIEISVDALGRNEKPPASWDSPIPATKGVFDWDGTSYGERVDDLLKNIKDNVILRGKGKIDPSRLIMKRGTLNKASDHYKPIKR